MAFRHGKDTFVSINGSNYSPYSNSTAFGDTADAHDVTCYGASRKAYQSGLGDGTITVGGVFDDSAAGPRAIFKPIKAQQQAGTLGAVEFIFRPAGTGSGKEQSIVNVIITAFNESSPVADNITWTAELQMSGALDETDQA
jgi:hypothetical protein